MNSTLPGRAQYVIVGGGAVGCGVAYSLAEAGCKDILLLERADDLGQVTTSQGAGLCGQPRDSVERIKLAMRSVATFRKLQSDGGSKPDWHEVGSLRIALSEKRVAELQTLKKFSDEAGLETAMLEPEEARKRWPLMNFDRVKAVLWCPSDGYMTPGCVVKAYADASGKMGVRFATSVSVEGIVRENGKVKSVQTNRGSIECEKVINAAGAHAYHIAKLAGLELPIVPVRHEYFVTVPVKGLGPDLPCFRIPELTLYGRVRENGLLLGGWEPKSLHTDPRSYEGSGKPPEIKPDWPVLNDFAEKFRPLFPSATIAEVKIVAKGWPTFTPDGRFIIGESSVVRGFVMAGGCNAHGISGSAGIGHLLVQSLLEREPSNYVKSLSPDRFTEKAWDWSEACKQAQAVYETYYGV
jgi:glycine/D-amino acid oxidase-like deaminating enzyme